MAGSPLEHAVGLELINGTLAVAGLGAHPGVCSRAGKARRAPTSQDKEWGRWEGIPGSGHERSQGPWVQGPLCH